MKMLFMEALKLLHLIGNVTEASLYKSGMFSTVTVETKEGTFTISIRKDCEGQENGN